MEPEDEPLFEYYARQRPGNGDQDWDYNGDAILKMLDKHLFSDSSYTPNANELIYVVNQLVRKVNHLYNIIDKANNLKVLEIAKHKIEHEGE